ncbi:MAG: hypothetical protein IKR21_02350, partial [Oscillospiraceae bacterium]|nr:hypothetical protein [Oscillospiraceae bacterium]
MKKFKRTASCFLALILLLSMLPAHAAYESGWAADIESMLSAGPYVEGEVIVGVEPAYADAFDLAAVLGLRESLDGEDIMTVPMEESASGEAVLTVISRPDKTTEELLYALAGDKRVVFAEPNYIMEKQEPISDEALTGALLLAEETGAEKNVVQDKVVDLTPLQWGPRAIHTPSFG